MATHALAFLDGLGIDRCDVLGYSLGGMVAQQMVQDRPPNAVLLTFPDAAHGSLFQWHVSFQNQVSRFLASESPFAPY